MSSEFSAYPEEREVLVQDGLEYRVTAVSQERTSGDQDAESYVLVHMVYPAGK